MDIVRPTRLPAAESETKFAGLAAVRGLAALGVVLFHACIPYLRHPMPGLTWAVTDRSSAFVDLFYWWIELFIMPLFLVMAGFLAWKTLQKRGVADLVRSRARRLLKPLLFGAVVVLPLDLYCWVLGWVADGIVAPVKLRSLKFDDHLADNLWGLSHLWFLQYLFLYVLVTAAAVKFSVRLPWFNADALNFRVVLGAIVALGTVTLCVHPEVVWGFQHAFAPVPSKWIYGGLSFALGIAVARYDSQLWWLKANGRRLTAPAVVCSAAAVLIGQWHLSGGSNQAANVALAVLTCASSILVPLGMISIATRRVRRISPLLGYLSAASFWVYIVHHPILGLVHIDLKFLLPESSPILKTVLAFAVTSGLCLLTYEGLVRRTALGRWLGFAWQLPTTTAVKEQPSVPMRFPRPGADRPAPQRRAA